MKKTIISAVGAVAVCLAFSAQAGTEQVNVTNYWVQVDPGQPVEMPSGAKGRTVMRSHATNVQPDGETTSQWCTGHQGVGPDGQQGAAGYCTVIYDNGDMLYVSYVTGGAGQAGAWTVMGGTGEYEGATGGGTTSPGSNRGDGRAWTSTSTGTITTQ